MVKIRQLKQLKKVHGLGEKIKKPQMLIAHL